MPLIKSAQKKMRQDKKRTAHNDELRKALKGLVKNMRRTPTDDVMREVSSALDRAVKTHLIHANKAARLKSRLVKGMVSGSSNTTTSAKKTTKKAQATA